MSYLVPGGKEGPRRFTDGEIMSVAKTHLRRGDSANRSGMKLLELAELLNDGKHVDVQHEYGKIIDSERYCELCGPSCTFIVLATIGIVHASLEEYKLFGYAKRLKLTDEDAANFQTVFNTHMGVPKQIYDLGITGLFSVFSRQEHSNARVVGLNLAGVLTDLDVGNGIRARQRIQGIESFSRYCEINDNDCQFLPKRLRFYEKETQSHRFT